jgi:hypothetical protein
MTELEYVDMFMDDTVQEYCGYKEPEEHDLEMFNDTQVVLIDGKPVYYKFHGNEIIYTDEVGNTLEVDLNGSNKLINKKGITMTMDYKMTMATYGLNDELIDSFKTRGCAYKPYSYYEGKLYVGSYLMLDNSGNPFTVLETTFKGDLQKSKLNVATLGFYDIEELAKLGDVQLFNSYQRKILVKSVSTDELFEDMVEETSHEIHIYKVTLGNIEVAYFLNATTGESNGSKLWTVYMAEQTLRNKPKNLDTLFEDNLQEEINTMSPNMDAPHVNGEDMSKYAKEEF